MTGHVVDDGSDERYRGPRLKQAPKEWVDRAMARVRDEERRVKNPGIVERAREGLAGMQRAVEEIRLAVALDTMMGAALPGIRGAATPGTRQILFDSDRGSVHIQIRADKKGRLDLTGRFLSEEGARAGGRVVLEHADGETSRKLARSGEFLFRAVRPGPGRLRMEWPDLALFTDALELTCGSGV